ncbi:hypothetical protein GGS23DRAFT_429353 [Durotheca rogersii]|uniref:uncharacterized protein n=1 Tax=Durotheca rogersii TaxID=419775 RepID=UPI00221F0165|nr:uncharacterized protein GGS23DRAFT_429353 [Durotheca rogersii]KAI5865487.1 hypothetical protein GGS23DRAFT_429353 [Durotheca rogersii]
MVGSSADARDSREAGEFAHPLARLRADSEEWRHCRPIPSPPSFTKPRARCRGGPALGVALPNRTYLLNNVPRGNAKSKVVGEPSSRLSLVPAPLDRKGLAALRRFRLDKDHNTPWHVFSSSSRCIRGYPGQKRGVTEEASVAAGVSPPRLINDPYRCTLWHDHLFGVIRSNADAIAACVTQCSSLNGVRTPYSPFSSRAEGGGERSLKAPTTT